ncbi:NAD(P)H-dependent oxidoreductase [Haloechinothrix sp. LS1_15]|uniref:NADPH-dependent FMN reductase n=1 Tax=Haloechinothrix sp. LS1_15 TaxID=2652248 RepID=UPI0029486307|nr:NAD(P)H-dependent oxidoreductase [Haloechinothrix sp. LS1_15]MDV6011971.1 NAD(P)H-dependent oxidoreductase [Haloechinothrix sp. LS1_15]
MRIFSLQGSLGEPSRTACLVALAERVLRHLGADVETTDLRRVRIPTVDPRLHDAGAHPDPEVRSLLDSAASADAFLWASPVYHNSYSGILKNALDHLTIGHVAHKPVALCANGGRQGSTQPTDHLRIVARGLHGVAIPHVLVSRNDAFSISEGAYRIADRAVVTRMVTLCQQLVDYAHALASLRDPAAQPVSSSPSTAPNESAAG